MTSRPRVLVGISMHPTAMARLRATVDVAPYPTVEDDLHEELARCDGIIAYVPDIPPQALAQASRLEVISCHMCPLDTLAAAKRQGIMVTDVPSMRATVADMTVALLFAAARNIAQADAAIRQLHWGQEDLKIRFSGYNVFGKTLGILGLGKIGALVARRLRGFEMPMLYYDVTRNDALEQELGIAYRPLNDLLQEADIISVHVRLSEATRGMLGERELSLVKPGAILVNTARGALIDQHALYEALEERRIAAAGLDVLAHEPISPNDPLLTLDSVVLAPHLGGSTLECDMTLVEDTLRVLGGMEPLHPVQ